MQSIGSLIAMVASYAWMSSDERLKENIEYIGKAPQGHNLYTWEWNEIAKDLGINEPTVGVIAQELLETNPEVVSISPIHGYYMVDYGRVHKKFSLGKAHG